MKLWKPIDWLGYYLYEWWTPQLQIRTGVVLTIVGLVAIPYGPFSGEPLLVYEMSALALVLAGLSVLVTAVMAAKMDDDTTDEDLKGEANG